MRSDRRQGCTRRQVLQASLVGGGVLAASEFLAACGGSRSRPAPSVTSDVVDVTTFGAVGDGRADDTAAIQRGLNSLKNKQSLRFPGGKVFCHRDVLTVDTAGVSLVGPGELRATDEQRSAIKVQASDVTVEGLTLGIERTSRRWSTPDQHKLFIAEVSGVVVRNVRITGSAAAGLFALGSSDFEFDQVAIFDTRADGIHMTYGAHSGVVDRPVVTRSGDDGVAVVSYLQDGRVCHDIRILAPTVKVTTGGRGLSVVGGRDVAYRDISVDRSSAAAVYVACEGDPSNTFDSERISFSNGKVTGANTDSTIDHGAVLVYSGRSGGRVDDVQISGLSISGTRSGASRQIGVVTNGEDDEVSQVTFSDLELGSEPTPYQGNAPLDVIRLEAVSANGVPVKAGGSA